MAGALEDGIVSIALEVLACRAIPIFLTRIAHEDAKAGRLIRWEELPQKFERLMVAKRVRVSGYENPYHLSDRILTRVVGPRLPNFTSLIYTNRMRL